jgi:hypothetical protein
MQRYNEICDQLTHANNLSKEEIAALVKEGQGLYKDLGLNNDAMGNLNKTVESLSKAIQDLSDSINGLPSNKEININTHYNSTGGEYHTGGVVGLGARPLSTAWSGLTAHSGMTIPGAANDILINAQGGEGILPRSAMNKAPAGAFEMIRNGNWNVGGHQISYSPQVVVQGDVSDSTIQKFAQVLDQSADVLAKKMGEVVANNTGGVAHKIHRVLSTVPGGGLK